MQNQGLGGFPASAAQSMKPAALALPSLPGLAYQGMEVKKKGGADPAVLIFKQATVITDDGSSTLSPMPRKAGDLVIVSLGLGPQSPQMLGGGPGPWTAPPGSGGEGYTAYKIITDTSPLHMNQAPPGWTVTICAMVIRGVTSVAVRRSASGTDAAISIPAFTPAPNSLGVVTVIESAGTLGSDFTLPAAGTPNVFKTANFVHATTATNFPSAPFAASAIAACLANFPPAGAQISWPGGAGQNAEWWALELLS